MKKLPLLFLCVIFLFTGCGKNPAEPVDKFSGNISAEYNGVKIKAEITSCSNNTLNLKITAPKAMKGYKYRFKDDELTLTFKNMKLESDKDYLYKRDFSVITYNILKSIKKEDNLVLRGAYNSFTEYKGGCESGDFILKSDTESGIIKEFSIKELNYKAEFNKLKPIK